DRQTAGLFAGSVARGCGGSCPFRATNRTGASSLLGGARKLSKVPEAAAILASLGLPKAQQNDRSALTLLALANIKPNTSWKDAEAPLLRTVDIMAFIRQHHGKNYAPNSRETFRRQTLHQFEQARLVDRNPDDPTRPTNSGKNAYRLTDDALRAIR